jgi:hypothetical protein
MPPPSIPTDAPPPVFTELTDDAISSMGGEDDWRNAGDGEGSVDVMGNQGMEGNESDDGDEGNEGVVDDWALRLEDAINNPTISAYELEREANIERNRAMMAALASQWQNLDSEWQKKAEKQVPRQRKAKDTQETAPSRRSDRIS